MTPWTNVSNVATNLFLCIGISPLPVHLFRSPPFTHDAWFYYTFRAIDGFARSILAQFATLVLLRERWLQGTSAILTMFGEWKSSQNETQGWKRSHVIYLSCYLVSDNGTALLSGSGNIGVGTTLFTSPRINWQRENKCVQNTRCVRSSCPPDNKKETTRLGTRGDRFCKFCNLTAYSNSGKTDAIYAQLITKPARSPSKLRNDIWQGEGA